MNTKKYYFMEYLLSSLLGRGWGVGLLLLLLTSCSSKEKEYDATGVFEATEVTVSAKSTGV